MHNRSDDLEILETGMAALNIDAPHDAIEHGSRAIPAIYGGVKRDKLIPGAEGSPGLYRGIPGRKVGVTQKLLAYRDLLIKWNRVYNLTAIKDPKEALISHVLDSLAILPWVGTEGRLLDVGSGGGLPGIPLAIVRPSLAVTLVESAGKKAAFQRQAAIELDLPNVESWHGRVEDFSVPGEQKFERIVSRAFADLPLFVTLTRHLLKEGGCWLAMKGKKPEAEIAALPPDVRLEELIPLEVPMLPASRHLLVLRSVR